MSDKLKSIISEYNQFTHSRLWDDIKDVLGCPLSHAMDIALSHCNMVSLG